MTPSAVPGAAVVCLSPLPWAGLWTSRHEIAAELVRRGRPVLFVEPPRNVLRSRPVAGDRPVPAGMTLTTPPPHLPYGVLGRVPALAAAAIASNGRRYADHVARAVAAAGLDGGGTVVLNSFMPVLGHRVTARLPRARHLYHRTDELRSFPTHQPLHERYEALVVQEAHAVACSSPALAAPIRHLRDDVAVVRNGVDPHRFVGAVPDERLRSLAAPVAVVVGRIDHRTDPAVLAAIAAAATLVAVGPVAPGHRLPEGVHALGPVTPGEVPAVLAAADVAVVPYAGFEGDPLKVYEYLAAGLPTVVVDGPWLTDSPVADALDIVASPADLPAAVRRAAASRTPDGDRRRRAVAAEQSWSRRVDELLELLERAPRAAAR